MSKTNKDFDKIIRDSLKTSAKADENINSRLIGQFYAQDNGMQSDDYDGDSVSSVETYRKPTMLRRIGSIAAAAAVIAGIGGSMYAMNGFRNAPDTLSEIEISSEAEVEVVEETTAAIIEEATEAPEEEFVLPDYDMSTKEGIYSKMCSSIWFFDKVSARVAEYQNYKDGVCDLSDFQCDLTTGKAYGYMSRVNYENDLSAILAGEPVRGEEDEWISKGAFFGHICTYCDGVGEYWLDNYNGAKGYSNAISEDSPPRTGRTGKPMTADEWIEYSRQMLLAQQGDIDGNRYINEHAPWNSFTSGINTHLGTNCIYPSCIPEFGKLWDFDSWDIVGDLTYLDRSCVKIERAVTEGDNNCLTEYTIDKATGCVLNYVSYVNGAVMDYLVVEHIEFDDDATPVPDIDLSEWENYDETVDKPTQEEYYAYKTNSHGETYGIGGIYFICNQNADLLPDLWAFGGGYVKKSEFMENIGCEHRLYNPNNPLFDLHQEHQREEGDVLICTLNVYDCEGETLVEAVNYYGTLEQKAAFETVKGTPCTDPLHKDDPIQYDENGNMILE